jgi:hypothetical protein
VETNSEVIIHKDMVVINKSPFNYSPILTFSRFDAELQSYLERIYPEIYELDFYCQDKECQLNEGIKIDL